MPIARRHTWLAGSRLSLAVDNLFDSRQSVRTAVGDTPIRYQPSLTDPLGRTVMISFRKLLQ
jgi:outer membrane receptor protein involved in Fe transport